MDKAFTRNDNGKIQMNRISLDKLLHQLFVEARTESEMDFIYENVTSAIEVFYDESELREL